MDAAAVARKIVQDPTLLGDELAIWMQKCRWAGLSDIQYPKDYGVSIDLCQKFSFAGQPEPFLLLGITITLQNPRDSRSFCVIFAFVKPPLNAEAASSYPISTTFAPSITQGQWVLQLASLNPIFVISLLQLKSPSNLTKGTDFTLDYIPSSMGPSFPSKIREIKVLGGGDTTNSIVRVAFDAPAGFPRVVFKSYLRLVEHNIEAEVISQLHSVGFSGVPALQGSLALTWGRRVFTLIMVSEFVENEGDGGKPFWDHLQLYLNGTQALPQLKALLQKISPLAHLVGKTTQQFHMALSKSRKSNFRGEKATLLDVNAWSTEFREKFTNAAKLCVQRLPKLFPQLISATFDHISKELSSLEKVIGTSALVDPTLVPTKQRIHGDLHLGQFLYQPGDPVSRFIVTDLEGDPQLPPERRREKRTVWFDLGGLLRALDYIAFFGAWECLKRVDPSHAWSVEEIFLCFYSPRAALPLPALVEQQKNNWEPIVNHAVEWAEYVGKEILRGYGLDVSLFEELPVAFKLARATSELNYELGFRGQNALVPLLGVLTAGRYWVKIK